MTDEGKGTGKPHPAAPGSCGRLEGDGHHGWTLCGQWGVSEGPAGKGLSLLRVPRGFWRGLEGPKEILRKWRRGWGLLGLPRKLGEPGEVWGGNKGILGRVGGSQENLRGLEGIWGPREGFGGYPVLWGGVPRGF